MQTIVDLNVFIIVQPYTRRINHEWPFFVCVNRKFFWQLLTWCVENSYFILIIFFLVYSRALTPLNTHLFVTGESLDLLVQLTDCVRTENCAFKSTMRRYEAENHVSIHFIYLIIC